MNIRPLLYLGAVASAGLLSTTANATDVRVDLDFTTWTDAGALDGLAQPEELVTVPRSFTMRMLDSTNPALGSLTTVENFLKYVADGDYANSFVHRSAKTQFGIPFVIQGGGFTIEDLPPVNSVPTDPPIADDPHPNRSNVLGTVAMARSGVDTATSQWFVNLKDNSFLDPDFTVFAEVIEGMDTIDAIANLERINAGGPFNEMPLYYYDGAFAGSQFVKTNIHVVGDADLDGYVHANDFGQVASQFGTSGDLSGDLNDDTDVNLSDFGIVAYHFGSGLEPAATLAVPEPGSIALLALGALMIGPRRR